MFSLIKSPLDFSSAALLARINWGLIILVLAMGLVGVAMLYSAAGGSWTPWAGPQLARLILGMVIMGVVALTGMKFWIRYAYAIYAVTLLLLLIVEIMGQVGMGAQRWINLGFFVLQPSELMKISLALALARYFHECSMEQVRSLRNLLPPLILVGAPVALVLMQPNLGTALLLLMVSGALAWAAGVRAWIFLGALIAAGGAVPLVFHFLHDYQKERVYTFLDPARDPWGAGYNILQSKIALGSGGLLGKGFIQGTQGQLMFLPEKHTDFIFVLLSEEFGFIGGLILLGLFVGVLVYGYLISLHCRNQFGRLLAFALTTNFFLYVVVNVAMVSGLIPVVGIPFPLVSYGGTATLTLLVSIGILLSISLQRDQRISRGGAFYP